MSERPTLTVIEESPAPADGAQPGQDSAAGGGGDTPIADLERRLSEAIVLETEMVRHLEDHRTRISNLADDLRTAHEAAILAAVGEAERQRQATLAEAEAAAEAVRIAAAEDAEREATQITQQAFAKSRAMVAAAEEEAAALLEARRQELGALEAEAKERLDQLEAHEEELLGRIEVAERIYQELEDTLRAVAQASISELTTAKTALAKMQHPSTPRRRTDDR